MRKGSMIAMAVVLLSFFISFSTEGVTLIEKGRAKSLIVLSEKAVPRSIEFQAAKILSDHLFLISGTRLDIKRENELGAFKVEKGVLSFDSAKVPEGINSFVLVGESAVTKALGVTMEGLGPGGIRLKSGENSLVLLGSTAPTDNAGTRYAVIEFLSSLGVRYLWPGETGRVIPALPTISIDSLDYSFTPQIGQRTVRWSTRITDRSQLGLTRLQITEEEWTKAQQKSYATEMGMGWSVWHRLGGRLGIGGGHAGGGLTGGWKEHGAQHPEWFALQPDGTRDQSKAGDRWRLCKSNPELIEYVAKSIIERVNADPSIKCISLCPNDGGYSNFCMCDNCKKLDPPDGPKIKLTIFEKVGQPQRHEIEYVSLTDRMVWYWNQIAQRVVKVHPDLLLLGEAYSAWSYPPVHERLHPNLVIRYVPEEKEGLEGWQKAGCKYIYWRPNILLAGRRDGKANVLLDRLADIMSYMAEKGILATDFDSILDNWAVHGLNYYAAARLNWNPYLTESQILDEYCSPGFGKGAEQVKQYFLLLQKATSDPKNLFTPELFASLRKLLNEAEKAAGSDAKISARIAFLRMGLNFTDLQYAIDRMVQQAVAKDPAFDKERSQQLLELNYLTLRDLALHHNGVVHGPNIMWGSGDYAGWTAIRGRGYRPAKERVEQAQQYSLTGRENSFEGMRKSLGLDKSPAVGEKSTSLDPKVKVPTVMDADEQGRPIELPAN